jgi:hypothetical protein
MKRLVSTFIVTLFVVAAAFAHDPRTVAKNFSHSLSIEGAGKLTLDYKSLHFNEAGFNNRKAERALTNFNRLWKTIGKYNSDFDVVIGGVNVPKGSYSMGFNYDANDNFKLILAGSAGEISVPLQFAMDAPVANYLTVDLRPENETDTFMFEVRYGKARVSAEAKVPYLAPHGHDGAKPAEKKP